MQQRETYAKPSEQIESIWPLAAGRWPLAATGLALVFLNACGGGGGASPVAPTAETINGIVIPPAPANPTVAVAGVDTNTNGVRDDVERALATRFGNTPTSHSAAIVAAGKLQSSLSRAPAAATQATFEYSKSLACSSQQNQAALQAVEEETLDTRERQKAAVDAYVALIEAKLASNDTASLSSSNCP